MTSRAPLVTLGVPVYNGAAYLAQTLESLLGQTFTDFELLIADNASTDRTVELCSEFAARDPRVRLIRQERNIGAPRNWNRLVHEARGRYFKWASASDRCVPDMLAACVRVLENEPHVVLCYGCTQIIDGEGQPAGIYDGDLDFNMPRASDRFDVVCRKMRLNNPILGVVRTEALRGTGLDRLYPGGDMVLTAELALHGELRLLSQVMLHRRQATDTFTSMRSPLEVQRLYDPHAVRPMRLLCARRHLDCIVSIARAPIPLPERLRAWGTELKFLRWDRGLLWNEMRSLVGATSP